MYFPSGRLRETESNLKQAMASYSLQTSFQMTCLRIYLYCAERSINHARQPNVCEVFVCNKNVNKLK